MTITKTETALGWYWSETKGAWQLARIPEDDRLIHLYVVGASGSGKTKFLEALIRQDLAAGQGCGVIDPHGDLIEDLVGYLAVLGRERGLRFLREEVVLVDLADPEQTVAFNPIERVPGVSAGEQAAELISAFKKIWADSWGVRMEDLLRNTLIALSEADRSLVDLPRFLTDGPTRTQVLATLGHPIARDYFARFGQLAPRTQLTWAEPVLNKVNALLANDHVRQLLAAPQSSFNLRDVMDRGQILLVKLDKGRLKDAADLVGSLLLAKLQLAAFSRSDLPVWERRPWYLYVDEFQNFATASFGVLLSEARKYGLSLVLAHQTLAQIPESLRSLILGNVGLQVVFRVNRHDAETLAKESFTYSGYAVKTATLKQVKYWSLGEEWERYTAALQALEPRQAWVKHKIQGGIIPIQTVDVPAAWQLLRLSPTQYRALRRGLPVGAAALRPRRQLDQPIHAPTPSPVDVPAPSAVSSGMPADVRPESNGAVAAKPEVAPGRSPIELVGAERDFLMLVLEQPELTVSQLYQRFGASVWKGARLRERLVAGGYLVEVETRLGKGNRPATYLIPTAQAIDALPTRLPRGRGGPVHRHLQRLIVAEASSKGFSATTEQELANGGIVDVHIERGRERVAVEISVTSDASREVEHITAALQAGYDQVISLTTSAAVRRGLERRLIEAGGMAASGRVVLATLEQIGTLL